MSREEWRFHSVDALERALYEYCAFEDDVKCQRYNTDPGGGDSAGLEEKRECVMRQNRAIDRAMLRLRHWSPLEHRLLDAYFREALCYEAQGWIRAWQKAGLPYSRGRGDEQLKATFDVLLSDAIRALFVAHWVRPRRTLDARGGRVYNPKCWGGLVRPKAGPQGPFLMPERSHVSLPQETQEAEEAAIKSAEVGGRGDNG